MEEHHDELDHLHGGQVLLPPQVFLILRTHGSQKVVGIHDDMDGSVEHAKESGMATRCELNTPPYSGWHDAVVDDMQVGDLVELFAKHKEDSIQEFCEFAEVIPPAQFCNDQFVRIIGVINWLAGQTVTSQPSMLEYLS